MASVLNMDMVCTSHGKVVSSLYWNVRLYLENARVCTYIDAVGEKKQVCLMGYVFWKRMAPVKTYFDIKIYMSRLLAFILEKLKKLASSARQHGR